MDVNVEKFEIIFFTVVFWVMKPNASTFIATVCCRMLVTTARRHNPEDNNRNFHRRVNLVQIYNNCLSQNLLTDNISLFTTVLKTRARNQCQIDCFIYQIIYLCNSYTNIRSVFKKFVFKE